jgi:hypothetical protein
VLRVMLGSEYAPISGHLPHEALTHEDDYRRYFASREISR